MTELVLPCLNQMGMLSNAEPPCAHTQYLQLHVAACSHTSHTYLIALKEHTVGFDLGGV